MPGSPHSGEISAPTLRPRGGGAFTAAEGTTEHLRREPAFQHFCATAETLREQLTQMVKLTEAAEPMVQDMLAAPGERAGSRELIAVGISGSADPGGPSY